MIKYCAYVVVDTQGILDLGAYEIRLAELQYR